MDSHGLSAFSLLVLLSGAGLLSCAGDAGRSPARAAGPVTSRDAGARGPADATSDTLPPLETLSARQAHLAPGLREIARGEADDRRARVELLHADKDTCVRVTFAASPGVQARLEGQSGALLAELGLPTPDGALGRDGPVCVRAGDAVVLVLSGSGPFRARYVAWGSP